MHNTSLRYGWDERKRQRTLADRGIDFAEVELVFAGPTAEYEDVRRDYGERRIICFGLLRGRLVAVGYVQRADDHRHIFSMRKANVREIHRFSKFFDFEGDPGTRRH